MTQATEGHIYQRYSKELSDLHRMVTEIDALVRAQLRDASQALENEDVDWARQIVARDKKVNELDVQADDAMIHLIAKRQPVARDLRDILAVGKIVTDLERVGDEARKIARLVVHFYDTEHSPPSSQLLRDVHRMARIGGEMVEEAVRAFDTRDVSLALEVIRRDNEIREEFKSALRRLTTFLFEDPRSVGFVVEIVLALRAMERVGSHGKNIAGYVIFLVKGKDVRHVSLEEIEIEVRNGA